MTQGWSVDAQDAHVASGDQQHDAPAAVGVAHPDVVELALVALRHPPGLVDLVVTDPVAVDIDARTPGSRLGAGLEGLHGVRRLIPRCGRTSL